MINFIYLAHSKERYRKQTVYSALTLLEFMQQSPLERQIVVYTDEPEFFEPLEVVTVKVSDEKLKEWKGAIDFVHRGKICVMLDAAERFGGRLMFLDSDNCFHQDPADFLQEWGEETVIMEKLEYVLRKPGDLVGKKYKRFFKKSNQFGDYQVTMEQPCWNSGVIGLPEKAKPHLKHILEVCDEMHQQFPKHLSEQMAFSIVLNHHFKIVPFKNFTYHWFGHGQAINRIIDRLLYNYPNERLDELIDIVSSAKQEVMDAPLNPDKLPWYKRWFS